MLIAFDVRIVEFSFQTRDIVILKINTFSVESAMVKEHQSQDRQKWRQAIHLVNHQMLHLAVYHVADHAYYVANTSMNKSDIREFNWLTVQLGDSLRLNNTRIEKVIESLK